MISIRTAGEIAKIRECGKVNAYVHERIQEELRPGITTKELDALASEVIHRAGAKSSIYGPLGFPAHVCISLNDEVGHGVPGDSLNPIKSGDVVKVDVSVQYEGYHTDCAMSHIVGHGSPEATNLIDVTRKALWHGITCAESGKRCSDISFSIHRTVKQEGYSVIRHAFGHGIGTNLHEAPIIANFGPANFGPKLRPGMVIAIEPVVSAGSHLTYRKANGWTDVTVDGSLSSHFEHTVLITEQGSEVLTQMQKCRDEKKDSVLKDSSILCRDMVEADKPQLYRLAAQEMDSILIGASGRRVDPDEIFLPQTKSMVLEHQQDGIVGFFVYSELQDTIHLNTLVISEAYQRRGIGQWAMKYLDDVAGGLHLGTVRLCVQTNNQRAIEFYQRLGFRSQGASYVNTVLMTKRL